MKREHEFSLILTSEPDDDQADKQRGDLTDQYHDQKSTGIFGLTEYLQPIKRLVYNAQSAENAGEHDKR